MTKCSGACKKNATNLRSYQKLHKPTSSRTIRNQQRTSGKFASGFSIWAQEQHNTTDPRHLKSMWSTLSSRVKNRWRRLSRLNRTGKATSICSVYPVKAAPPPMTQSSLVPSTGMAAVANGGRPEPDSEPNWTTLTECSPSNAAAHLLLLGECLQQMGESLAQHEGQISLAGTLSVLLDSFLCSLGPLMALTRQIPHIETNPHLDAAISSTLDNNAYILPGLQVD